MTIRYVIVRRVGDFDEYLQDDGNFGPLTDHQALRLFRVRLDVTRIFFDRDDAGLARKKWMDVHPFTSEAVPLEIWRLP